MNELISSDDILDKDILELIGAAGLSEEEKDRLYARMINTINYRIIDRIEDELSEESKINEWRSLVEAGNSDAVNKFYVDKNIDISAIAADEALKYKVEVATYITIAERSGKTLDEIYSKLENNGKHQDGVANG